MNIVKRMRSGERQNRKDSAALARRNGDWTPAFQPFEDSFARLWRDLGRDFWSAWSFDPFAPIERAGNSLAGVDWPTMDVEEDEKNYILRFDVPGMQEKDLQVEVAGDVLTVSGTRAEECEDRRRQHRECVYGSFSRSVTLPDYVDTSALQAACKNGVLTVTAPKLAGKAPRRIPIAA